MLQMNTDRMNSTYRLFDLQGTFMPTANDADGLFVYALIRPDQVDVWDREPPHGPWDDQINRSD